MPLSAETQERHARDLARFQALALRAAEKAGELLEAADGAEALSSAVASLHRAGRALRQSIALEAKLARDADRDAQELAVRDAARRERAVAIRKAQVRHAVERLIWTEHERSDAQVAAAELSERLEVEALDDGFLDEPLEAHVARTRQGLGLKGDGAGRYMPRAFRATAPEVRLPQEFYDRYFADAQWEAGDDDEAEAGRDAARDPTHAPDAEVRPGPTGGARPPDLSQAEPSGRLAPPMDLPSWEDDSS